MIEVLQRFFVENFDIIVSNPPYVCECEKELMQKNVLDFEPELALFVPDDDPLRFYRRIAELSGRLLKTAASHSILQETLMMFQALHS